MKVGDITEPLRIPTGYQILKLESRSESETAAFDQAKDRISDLVFADKRKDEYEKYLEQLARAGHHRLEERGHQEGLRDRRASRSKTGTAPLK